MIAFVISSFLLLDSERSDEAFSLKRICMFFFDDPIKVLKNFDIYLLVF